MCMGRTLQIMMNKAGGIELKFMIGVVVAVALTVGCIPQAKAQLIHSAAKNGDLAMVQKRLEDGDDVNDIDEESLNTALMLAAGSTSSLLLDRVVDPVSRHQIVERLIQYGADINTQNHRGCTALMLAAYQGNTDVVELLLQHGADVNIKDNAGWDCPGHNGWHHGGWTALMYAASWGNKGTVEVLLQAGAALVDIKDNTGRTAVDIAKEYKRTEVIKLIERFNRRDMNTKSAKSA